MKQKTIVALIAYMEAINNCIKGMATEIYLFKGPDHQTVKAVCACADSLEDALDDETEPPAPAPGPAAGGGQ